MMRRAVSLARGYRYHMALERYCGFAVCTALNREAVAGIRARNVHISAANKLVMGKTAGCPRTVKCDLLTAVCNF